MDYLALNRSLHSAIVWPIHHNHFQMDCLQAHKHFAMWLGDNTRSWDVCGLNCNVYNHMLVAFISI